MRVYIDADILIWHLRRHPMARALVTSLVDDPESELWTGAMQRAEVLFRIFAREEAATMGLFSLFSTAAVTEQIVDLGARLFRQWNPSHGTDTNDALLAATALISGGKIVTQNVRHYPMPDIVVERGWD